MALTANPTAPSNSAGTAGAAVVAVEENKVHDFAVAPFEIVGLDELKLNTTRKNSASYQLITAFMSSGLYAAKPPLGSTKMTGKTAMTLTQFARQHKFPVRAMNRDGQLILRRLDHQPGVNGKLGDLIPNWEDTDDAKPRVRAARGSKTTGGKPIGQAAS